MLTAFGSAAVSVMLVSYRLESRPKWFVLIFAVGCASTALYLHAARASDGPTTQDQTDRLRRHRKQPLRKKPMNEFVGYRNGQWMPMSEITPDPADRGTNLGDQVVEVERTFGGNGFRIKDHIDRMYKSLKYVRISPDITAQEMMEVTEEGIRRNAHLLAEHGDFSITQLVTRGPGGPRTWAALPTST